MLCHWLSTILRIVFADQPWLIYDIKRAYGFYYDLKEVRQVTFEEGSREGHLVTGMLDESLMDKDEKLFSATLEDILLKPSVSKNG